MSHVLALVTASLLVTTIILPVWAKDSPIDITLTCENNITADFHYAGGMELLISMHHMGIEK